MAKFTVTLLHGCSLLQNFFLQSRLWSYLLPSANEVCGKLIFSQVFVHGGGGGGFPASITGHNMTRGVCLQGGGGGYASRGDWTDLPRSAYRGGGVWANPPWDTWDTAWYSQEAGSTHPTGMLSCWGWIRDDGHIISIVFELTICNLCKRFVL